MMRLHELSQLVGGNLNAQADLQITGAASITRAGDSEITFACTEKHFQQFLDSDAAAAVIPRTLNPRGKPCLQVDNVEAAFVTIAKHFKPPIERPRTGVSERATVSPTADLAPDVCVHPGAVIMDGVQIGSGSVVYPNVTVMENCIIGQDVQIFPGSTLYENTQLGDRVIIHAGVVLGAYGFGYRSSGGTHQLSAQLGNVVIGDDVEIGANSTIDRGTYDATTIGNGSKLDNLVMVGHNCAIGQHNLLCSQVGIAGSCQTGDYVIMGGQVGLADHLSIGNHVSIGAKSGLMHDIEDHQKYFGIPARPAREEMQILANRGKLPEMRRALKQLQKQVEALAELNATSEAETAAVTEASSDQQAA